MVQNITILGSGNVATHLANQLSKHAFNIIQVYSRNITNANELAQQVAAEPIDNISELNNSSDLYIICLSDSIIEKVVERFEFTDKLVAHTAGSMSIDVLKRFKNHGVFYPLQSFTKNRSLDFETIPICIEANSKENENKLLALANKLSNNVNLLQSEERKQYHLAAVFANNFANHMFAAADSLLKKNKLNFDLLKPLILETAQKIQKLSPIEAQTGPAIRNNMAVIDSHIQQISLPELEKLYSFVSNSIIALHNK